MKRIRRLLAAHTADGTRPITLDVYDEHIRSLIDWQLEFGRFKRRSPSSTTSGSEHEAPPVRRFGKLAGFIGDAFKVGAADRIDEIIAALQGAIVQPAPDRETALRETFTSAWGIAAQ